MSSNPEIRRDVPGSPHGGPIRPLPSFFAPPAHPDGPPAPALVAEGWMTGAPALRAGSPGRLAGPPPAPSGRSPFPLEAIEID